MLPHVTSVAATTSTDAFCAILELPAFVVSTAKPCAQTWRWSVDHGHFGSCFLLSSLQLPISSAEGLIIGSESTVLRT